MERDNPSLPDPISPVEEGTRVVAFPEDNQIREEKVAVGLRPRGVEMKRILTQEDKDLAAAGYEHLHPSSNVNKLKETNIDITDHQLDFDALVDTLKTNFNVKDPGHSFGLTANEAKIRVQRDGPNILTPPKKKSAFRKVCGLCAKKCFFSNKKIDNLGSSWNAFSRCSTFFLWSLVYWNTLS
jgi:sodium/potassium-transporting ATPase subunit alpha